MKDQSAVVCHDWQPTTCQSRILVLSSRFILGGIIFILMTEKAAEAHFASPKVTLVGDPCTDALKRL